MHVDLINHSPNGEFEGQYQWMNDELTNKVFKNLSWLEGDQLVVYKAQPMSWTWGNQEPIQWVAGWRAWTPLAPDYKPSALTTQPHCFWRVFTGFFFLTNLLKTMFPRLFIYRQKLYRWRNNLKEPDVGILFPGITRPDADEGIVDCIKYLFNKFFFHFGWEVSVH